MWMERVEATLGCSDRQYSEMRDKTANLGKTKVQYWTHCNGWVYTHWWWMEGIYTLQYKGL